MFCPRNFALRKSVMGRLFPTWVVLILGAVLPSQCVRAQGARQEPVAERKRGQPARAVVVEVAPAQGGEVRPVPVLPAPVVELEGAVEAIVVGGGVIDGRDGPMVQVIQREALPAGVEVQIQLEGGAEARPVPPDPDAEVRKQTAEKLRQRVDVRINNKSLQGALDELAEAHGFKYRFDEASLEQAGVQPEKALVGLNVRRQPLVAVLREILQGHGLQFGLDGDRLVIVALPKLPEGVRRKKARANAPVEQVVLGNVLVSDAKQEEEPKDKPVDIQIQLPVVGGNAEQRKQVRDQQLQSFQQMFAAQWKNEVATCLALGEFSAEQKKALRTVAQQAFDKVGGEWADGQVQMMFGGQRGGNEGNRFPNVRGAVQQAIWKVLKESPRPERAELYEREFTARTSQRQRATIHNLVSQVDRQLTLSDQQREELEALLAKEWQPQWVRALEFLQWDGNNVFPNLPAGSVEKLLTEPQAKIWQGLQRIDLNNIWGGGFNFFNQQQVPAADDAGEAAGEEAAGPVVVPGAPVEVIETVIDTPVDAVPVEPEERKE